MEIFLWIIGGIVAIIIWSIYNGGKKERAYQQIIADLQMQLTQNPHRFFHPYFDFRADNYLSEDQLMHILMAKIIDLAIKRNIRSAFTASIIPEDILTLVDAKRDFERLFVLACSIANDR